MSFIIDNSDFFGGEAVELVVFIYSPAIRNSNS